MIRWAESVKTGKPITIQRRLQGHLSWETSVDEPGWYAGYEYREQPQPFEAWVAISDCYRTREDASRAVKDGYGIIHVRQVEE
jgi:hypothetical protein